MSQIAVRRRGWLISAGAICAAISSSVRKSVITSARGGRDTTGPNTLVMACGNRGDTGIAIFQKI